MSDLEAAAAALGLPEALVSRSAAARAEASGSTTEEVLAAWSGGGTVAAKAPPEPETESPAEEAAEPATPEAEAPSTVPQAAAAPPSLEAPSEKAPERPAVAASGGKPPVLVGVSDNPWAVVIGAAALFAAVVLLTLVGPSIPLDEPGARTSAIDYSSNALAGQETYAALGCAGCHTQMVRPVVADVGVGAVTLSDTNQILGLRRYGPDLSDVGSRVSGTQLEAIVRGSGGHPSHNLSSDDMSDLVAYLTESATAVENGDGSE